MTTELVLINTFAKHLLKKFTEEEVKQSVNEYAKDKTDQQIKLLNDLVIELSNSEISATQPLFENIQPPVIENTIKEKKQNINPKTPVREFISLYSQLYAKKFNRKPILGESSWGIYGKLLKTKIEQGYPFEDLVKLLHKYAKPENSDYFNFQLRPFFSDTVFNKMLAQLAKDSNQVPEGKYDKYEI